jgi:LPS-assembly protein
MHKSVYFLFFVCLCVFTVHAAEEKGKIEVLAKSLESTKNVVHANEGVLVYYDNSVIKAKKATYNKLTKVLVLDGQVEMIGYEGSKEHTDHMEIQTDTKEVSFKNLFLSSENDVWLITDKAHKKEGNYTLGRSILSSCEVDDPLWKMTFEHSLYDMQKKYMKVYHAKVYFLDFPIFYSPYLGFSTQNQRTSGLLFPLFGYSSKEGFVYEQPIFWAINPSMDMEFNPQVRTNRSIGGYTTFRFVDSQYSSGKVRMGYFKDKKSYVDEYTLPEDSHYGIELNYDSSNVLRKYLPTGYKDGLYINTTYLNDIDYLNLQKTHLQHFGLNPIQESRVNYYLYNDTHYTGINAKYFIDLRPNIDKEKTIQILPSIQWHKYLNHLVWDKLTYSVDTHFNNFTRTNGVTLKQAEIRIPLEFTTSFLDDFINLSLGEEFYYSKFFFGNGSYVNNEFQYYSNIHKAKFFTDLTKKYDSLIHVLQPSIEYIKPGNENQSPVNFESLLTEQKELFTVGLPEEQYRIGFNQYLYTHTMGLKFFQRISQIYYPERSYKWADLENEMQYNFDQWRFYNRLKYSYEFGKLRESSSSISLVKPQYNFTLGHSYKQKLADDKDNFIPSNDVNFNFAYIWNEHINIEGGLTYDIVEASSKQWRFGGKYHQDCWSVTGSVRQDILPRPTGFTRENTFYVEFNFIPFGGVGAGSEN